jgi:HipA-like protein
MMFAYSADFMRQRAVQPIVNFPLTAREYRSRTLWPFFALRIPSSNKPAVQEFLRQRGAVAVDEAILLREFGGRTIANPFQLVPVQR